MKSLSILTLTLLLFFFYGCRKKSDPATVEKFFQHQLPEWNDKLTQVIISDIFSPPVASRIYAYANIAAYEALQPAYKNYSSYGGKLNGLQPVPQPTEGTRYFYPISGIIAFTTAAGKLVFNSEAIKETEKIFIKQLDNLDIDDEIIESSVFYGRQVGNHILAWAAKDGYLERNSIPAYIVTKESGRWQPTPPTYADAIETNWKTLKPLVLNSCSQFKPVAPTKYDTAKNSAFYKEAYQVYEAVNKSNKNDSALAWYWDDNPNTSITEGHITYFQQKIHLPGTGYILPAVLQKKKSMTQ